MERELEVHFAEWRSIIVVIWRGNDTEAGADALVDRFMGRSMDSSHPIGLLHIVESDAAPPNAATRRRLNHLYKTYKKHIAFNLTAFEGDGFRAAAVRAIAGGMARFVQVNYPFEVHPTVNETAKRAIDVLGYDAPSILKLLSVIESARVGRAA